MKRKKRRISNGAIFINLLPCITALGIGGAVVCKTFGADILDSYNNWKLEHQFVSGNESTFDLPDMPTWDDIKALFGDKEENIAKEPEEDIIDLDSSSTACSSDYVEELPEVEEEIVEEEPEPVITPEYTSSELLDSGYEFLDIDFDGLKEQNEDIVGWIDVPGTTISYPVVQGDDNEYYLHHDLNGNNSANGTIFIDSRVDLGLGDDSSTVQGMPIGFYGHHMRSGKMFQQLMKFKQDGFVESNPYAVYYSPEGVYKLEFFGDQYVAGDSDEGLFTNQLFDEKQFNDFTNNIIDNSSFQTDVIPEMGDKIGYLVTCTYERDNLRYAVWYRAVKQYTNEIDKPYVNVLTLSN
jgi:sortase B